MTTAHPATLDDVLRRLHNPRPNGGRWRAPCPAHNGTDANLSVWEGDDGSVGMKCHSDDCDYGEIMKALGLDCDTEPIPSSFDERTDAVYSYHNADGVLLFEAVRLRNPKDFRQRHAMGRWTIKDVPRPLPLFHLPQLLSADPDEPVLFVEGEKDALRGESLGFVSTTTAMGAGKAEHSDLSFLDGRHVVIISDNDAAGERHADDVAQRLRGRAASVRLLTLPGVPEKGDLSDWANAGGTREVLELLIEQAPSAQASLVDDDEPSFPSTPPPEAACWLGIAGDFVREASPYTEAHPMALLIQFMAMFGAVAGRNPRSMVAATRHGANIYVAQVGDTSKARKGDSWNIVMVVYRAASMDLPRQLSGVGSGEGLIHAIRDPHENKDGEFVDGVEDKRAVLHESELARLLRVMGRESSTASPVLRDAWDGSDLSIVVRNNSARASKPHIALIAHITGEELRNDLRRVEMANGLGNRFLWYSTKRVRLVPEPVEYIPSESLTRRLAEALSRAQNIGLVVRGDAARALWAQVYESLSEGEPGIVGALTARAEAQVLRVSMIYSLIDGSTQIEEHHLRAALEVVTYCYESVRYLFADGDDDPQERRVLEALADRGVLSRNDIRHDVFANHISQQQLDLLRDSLTARGAINVSAEPTGGRHIEMWRAR